MAASGQGTADRDARAILSSEQPAFYGVLLQAALRALLVAFIATTIMLEPPSNHLWTCVLVLAGYAIVVAAWSVWTLRPSSRTMLERHQYIALLALGADMTVIAVLSVLTGLSSGESWTSDVLRNGLFLIPLIAAAQLDPYVSAAIAIPTVSTFIVVSWINQTENEEPWSSILLGAAVLAGLAAGSVALSLIQRSRVATIAELARQRTQLLEDMLNLEKRERQALSERLHDGALQYVLVARGDLEDVRGEPDGAVSRVHAALTECSQLLRDVVRELHPEVLSRSGLKAAITALTDGIAARSSLAVDLDARTWPDATRSEVDHVLYHAAREITTNVIKHAHAQHLWVELEQADNVARLRISDDGVGISQEKMAQSLQNGHIGMASMRAKVLATGGRFDVRATSPGTEIEISVPVRG